MGWKYDALPPNDKEVVIVALFRSVRFDTKRSEADIGWYDADHKVWHAKSAGLRASRELLKVYKWDYLPEDSNAFESMDNNTLTQTIEQSKYIVDECDLSSYKAGWNAALEQVKKWIGES